MKKISLKPRIMKGDKCVMGSSRKHHEEFIKELRSPLKSIVEKNNETSQNESTTDNGEDFDLELQRELERKFDELFGFQEDDED